MSTTELVGARREILFGLVDPTRRAGEILTASEMRVAHMRGEARRALAAYLLDEDEHCNRRFQLDDSQGEQGTGGQAPYRPTAVDLERYAPFWEALVSADPTLRGADPAARGTRFTHRRGFPTPPCHARR